MIGFYVLKNIINGKMYVGQSVDLDRRVGHHKRRTDSFIDRAINKYGWDNFEKHIFYVPEKLLDYFEIEMIKKLNTLEPNGYNIKEGGANGRRSEAACKRQSVALKGRAPWNKGKTGVYSKEILEQMSRAQKGHRGHTPTEETRLKMSKAKRGKKLSKETCLRISIGMKGVVKTFINEPKAVRCVETNVVYESINKASRETNICMMTICRVVNRKRYSKTAGGYHWVFI